MFQEQKDPSSLLFRHSKAFLAGSLSHQLCQVQPLITSWRGKFPHICIWHEDFQLKMMELLQG